VRQGNAVHTLLLSILKNGGYLREMGNHERTSLEMSSRMFGFSDISMYTVPVTQHNCPTRFLLQVVRHNSAKAPCQTTA